MIPAIQSVIKIIPTKQLKATTVTMTISLLTSVVVAVPVIFLVVNPTVQFKSSTDGIDRGHKGEDMIEKVLLFKEISREPNIPRNSRTVAAFVCIVSTALAM